MTDQTASQPARRTRTAAIAIAGLLAIGGGIAYAATPSAVTNTIYACVNKTTGAVRITSATQRCLRSETRVLWNRQGPSGAAGEQGPAGPAGEDGTPGAQGADGAQGPAGADGAQGPVGPEGPQGVEGPAGADGAQGPVGPEGPQGIEGPAGADGADGADGAQGPAGETGPAGPQGLVGERGPSDVYVYTSNPTTVTDSGGTVLTTGATETDPGSVLSVLAAECTSSCGATNTLVCDSNTGPVGTHSATINAGSGVKVQMLLLGWVNTGEEANITCQSGVGETWTVTARTTITSTATLHGII